MINKVDTKNENEPIPFSRAEKEMDFCHWRQSGRAVIAAINGRNELLIAIETLRDATGIVDLQPYPARPPVSIRWSEDVVLNFYYYSDIRKAATTKNLELSVPSLWDVDYVHYPD